MHILEEIGFGRWLLLSALSGFTLLPTCCRCRRCALSSRPSRCTCPRRGCLVLSGSDGLRLLLDLPLHHVATADKHSSSQYDLHDRHTRDDRQCKHHEAGNHKGTRLCRKLVRDILGE